MLSYLLRFNTPADVKLWKSFKARAKSEGRGFRWVLLALMERYVERGL